MKMVASVMCMREGLVSAFTARQFSWCTILSSARCCGLLLAVVLGADANAADGMPHLGRPLSAAQAVNAGVTIFADGRGLPAGSGDARLGKPLFAEHCARCHGVGGRGGSAPELVGGTAALASARPDRTIGLWWPFAPTLFDFNWRAMPMDRPGTLSADEAYAVTAYLLFAEGLIGEAAVMNRTSLPKVQMPNRAGFDWVDLRPSRSR